MEVLTSTLTIGPCEIPKLRPGQALVKIRYFGINAEDVKLFKLGVPVSQLGSEFSGEVVKIDGDSDKIGVGNRVVGFLSSGGSFAQYIACDLKLLVPIPAKLSFEKATCVPNVWVSSIQLLRNNAEFKKRERIAVIDCGNAVGLAIVQLAQILGVRRVHCVYKRALSDQDARAFELPAALPDEVVLHHQGDSSSFIKEIARYDPKGLEAVIDLSDAPNPYFHMLRPGGRLVWTANKHPQNSVPLVDWELMVLKNLRLHGCSIRSHNPLDFQTHMQYIQDHILPRFANGKLVMKPPKIVSWKLAGSVLRDAALNIDGPQHKVICKVD